eukprot:403338490
MTYQEVDEEKGVQKSSDYQISKQSHRSQIQLKALLQESLQQLLKDQQQPLNLSSIKKQLSNTPQPLNYNCNPNIQQNMQNMGQNHKQQLLTYMLAQSQQVRFKSVGLRNNQHIATIYDYSKITSNEKQVEQKVCKAQGIALNDCQNQHEQRQKIREAAGAIKIRKEGQRSSNLRRYHSSDKVIQN